MRGQPSKFLKIGGAGSSFFLKDALALSLPPSASLSPLPCVGGGTARCRHGQPPLRKALLPSGGTSQAGGVASRGCCPCWRPLLRATALVGGSPDRGAAPYGLAAGSHHLRPGRWPQPVVPTGLLSLRVAAPCRGPGGSQSLFCRGALAVVGHPLQVVGRPCKGAGHGHARLPLTRASFAAKTQQERVERFYAIQSHHTQFKTNLLHENLGSDTTVGKPTAGASHAQWKSKQKSVSHANQIVVQKIEIRIEKMKEVKRPPL
ncbi:hypothetical protein GW17_00020869 [Ensete ventricosum]|nr:hypothetical protein GW17_00020869 [Ensete ventricosum]